MSAEPATAERLEEAIVDGEILRVTYLGGTQPGTVRELRPLAVEGVYLKARDRFSRRPKHFFIAKLLIESADTPLTYTPRHSKRVEIDIETFSSGWAFSCPMPGFADAFDIARTERKRRDIQTGELIVTSIWTQGSPPEYAFDVGDTFLWPATARDGEWGEHPFVVALQVVEADGDVTIRRSIFRNGKLKGRPQALALDHAEFVELLRHGPERDTWRKLTIDSEK